MTRRDDDSFRPKVGPPRSRGDTVGRRFVSRVLKAASVAGGRKKYSARLTGSRRASQFHRGAVVARSLAPRTSPSARRVLIKFRLVNLKQAGHRSTQTHLRYIEREGATKEGELGKAYGPQTDAADTDAFEARGRADRHQFRFIVSPENAIDLEDLHAFTRDLMSRVENDLNTRLDWVAVDHWNTDNPHTHVVLRGKDQHGRDLVIAREYISHGLRTRASELATEWLGPRTEREIRSTLIREVDQERWTSLDQKLQRDAQCGRIDLLDVPSSIDEKFQRLLKIGRLQRLSEMGLAERMEDGVWTLRSDAESTLRAMGERGDIIRTMQRAFTQKQREFSITDSRSLASSIVGRLIEKGLADELYERMYVIVDGVDGRAHYVALAPQADVSEFPIGGIVTVRSSNKVRTVDENISRLTVDGVFRSSDVRSLAKSKKRDGQEVDTFVQSHERRLEALRRAGIVERIEAGVWRIPNELQERGRDYDKKRAGDVVVELTSHLPLDKQIRAIGATWLDQQLIKDAVDFADAGFGTEARSALRQRLAFLVDEGFADQHGTRVVVRPGLVATLRQREVDKVANSIHVETGLHYRPLRDGQHVSGIYRRSLVLNSGRFAMIDDGNGFSLVPWRPVIEKHLNQQVRGVVSGPDISWDFSKTRGIGR